MNNELATRGLLDGIAANILSFFQNEAGNPVQNNIMVQTVQPPIMHEVIVDTPITLTVPVTSKQLVTGLGNKWVTSFIIRVRSMGTATYIRVGSVFGRDYTLNLVGQTIEWAGNAGEVVDLSRIYVISDTADAVIELIASYLPIEMIGNVSPAAGEL